jgi:hypothetical protein
MRRAFVHIGMPRTGTTSLQAVLCAHRHELARAGVLYPNLRPRSASSPHLSHQYLGEAFDGRRPRAELRELLAALDTELAATDADVALLSYEGFSQLSRWHSAPWTLRELFARHGFQMQIAVTLKAQDLYAQSWYAWRCQFLREPLFFAESLPGILRHRRFNYLRCVRPWAIAAAGRVIAVPVHAQGTGTPLIERVLEALGLADRIRTLLSPLEVLRTDNRSPGPAAIEVARRWRERFGTPRTLVQARTITEYIATEAQLRGFASTGFQALDRATSEHVMARFAADNDRFARSMWGENWSRRVASVPRAPVNAFGPDCPPDHVDAQLEAIARQACRQFAVPDGHGLLARARALIELPRSAY